MSPLWARLCGGKHLLTWRVGLVGWHMAARTICRQSIMVMQVCKGSRMLSALLLVIQYCKYSQASYTACKVEQLQRWDFDAKTRTTQGKPGELVTLLVHLQVIPMKLPAV